MCLPKHNRIVLGTVQFGLPYGIANQNGQVSRSETAAILDHAWSAGLDTLDTAIAYGESEQRLGEINVEKWRVITKLSAIPENCSDVTSWAQKSLLSSLERLRIPKLYGMLLHRSKDLLGPHGDSLYNALLAGKDQGFVEKIGVSIYDPKELDSLPTKFKFDLVQAPYNIIDRRLALSGWLTKLHQAGTEIHVRSVFLQGLLLMKAEKKPLIFNRWQQLWDQWHSWLANQSQTSLQVCLGFVLAQPEIDHVVVGVESLKQLDELLAVVGKETMLPPESLMSEDLDLINPHNWSKL